MSVRTVGNNTIFDGYREIEEIRQMIVTQRDAQTDGYIECFCFVCKANLSYIVDQAHADLIVEIADKEALVQSAQAGLREAKRQLWDVMHPDSTARNPYSNDEVAS